jgi:outer membrane protein OmpA-like peptidoglycan-associated protein
MTRCRSFLFLLAALLTGLACSRPRPAPQAPVAAIQVDVISLPGRSDLFLKDQPLGTTPQTIRVPTMDALLDLTASAGNQQVVEERIRVLAEDHAEVLFVFGTGPSELAKALGLAKILVFDYGAGVTFDLDKAELRPDFLPLLERQAALLTSRFAGLDVYVCGHTDATGGQEHNLALSLARAKSVAEVLGARGVARDHLIVQGFGSSYPVASNEDESGRARNRRTEVVLPR